MILRWGLPLDGTVPAALLCLAMLVGCRSEITEVTMAAHEVSDSSGVRIIDNRAPSWDAEAAWGISSAPDLIIPSEQGVDYTFTRIVRAVRLADGSVAALDQPGFKLLFFEPDGRFRSAVGRNGQGPGEFLQPEDLLHLPGDTLVVSDAEFGPWNYFDSRGGLIRTVRIDLGRMVNVLAPYGTSTHSTPVGGNRLVAYVRPTRDVGPVARPDSLGFLRPIVGFLVVDSSYHGNFLGWYPGLSQTRAKIGGREQTVMPRISTTTVVTGSPGTGLVYLADGGKDEVRVYGLSGELKQLIRRHRAPTAITEAVQQSSHNQWVMRYSVFGSDAEAAFKTLPVQDHYPPIAGLLVDGEGFLWIRNGLYDWSVVSPEGRWLGDLVVPLNVVHEIGPDYLLGLVYDEDDTPRIEQYHLTRR